MLPNAPKSTELFDWQVEGMKIRDAYFAGDLDLETAMDQFVAWGAENAPRQAFARGSVTETVVVDNTLGNVPYFYVPELKDGRHHAAELGSVHGDAHVAVVRDTVDPLTDVVFRRWGRPRPRRF